MIDEVGTTYVVITPKGQFLAEWSIDEDEPVEYRGDREAIDYFYNYMAVKMVTGDGGRLLDPNYLEPVDLDGFCQSKEFGITVITGEPEEEKALRQQEEMEWEREMSRITLDSVSTEERMAAIERGYKIIERFDENSPDFFKDARALLAVIQQIPDTNFSDIDPRIVAIAEQLKKLGWKAGKDSEGSIALSSPRNILRQDVTIRIDPFYPKNIEFVGTEAYYRDAATPKELAVDIDANDFIYSKDLRDHIEKIGEESFISEESQSEFAGKNIKFVMACDVIEAAVKKNGGVLLWGDFNNSLMTGSLFDSTKQIGVTAQIGKDGKILGRAEIDAFGGVTIYKGSAGGTVEGAAKEIVDIAAVIDGLFSGNTGGANPPTTTGATSQTTGTGPDTIKPEEQNSALEAAREIIKSSEFIVLKKDIVRSLGVVVSIDKGQAAGYNRSSFVNAVTGKLKTRAGKNPLLVSVMLAFIYVAQSKLEKPAIAEKNSVWNLTEDWEMFIPLFKENSTTKPTEATDPEPAPPTAGSTEETKKDHSNQYWNYLKWIEDKKPVDKGMREVILMDERLTDGETDELLKMVDAMGPSDTQIPTTSNNGNQQMTAEEIQRKADIELMESVINETSPDMMDPILAKRLEAVHERIKDDPEIMKLFDRTADAYSDFAIRKAKEALGIS